MMLVLALLCSLITAGLLLWPRPSPIPRAYLVAALALMACATGGYFFTGTPALKAQPAKIAPQKKADPGAVEAVRKRLLEFPGDISAWLRLAQGLQKNGQSDAALEAMAVATKAIPDSADLWVMRGQLLVERSGGEISPAARYAFDRAAMIDPKHPAPRYMLALAWVMQGKPAEAKPVLEALLAETAQDAPYRAQIERLLRGVTAMTAAGVGADAPK